MKKILIFSLMFLMVTGFAFANPDTLFEDDFESGEIDLAKWVVEDTPEITSDPNFVNSGTYAVIFNEGNPDDSIISVSIDTTGHEDIDVSYYRLIDDVEDHDGFIVEYSVNGGSLWTILEDVSSGNNVLIPYEQKIFRLDSSANDNPDVKVRFRIDYVMGEYDVIALDDVLITGEFVDNEVPEISVHNTPAHPMCSSDITVCATVTDDSAIGFVDITCTVGTKTVTEFGVGNVGDEYCTDFSADTMGVGGNFPLDAQDFVCTVNAEDIHGNFASSGPTALATYDCADPNVVITGDLTCNEGEVVTLSAFDSWDTVTPFGDLVFSWTGVDSGFENLVDAEVSCIDDGTIPVSLTVTDNVQRNDMENADVVVSNVDPVAIVSGANTGDEGSDVELTASVMDDGVLDTHTFKWTVDSVDTMGDMLSVHCTDEELITVLLEVTDDDLGVGSITHDVQCQNVAPLIDAGDNQTVDQGQEVTVTPTFSDVGVDDVLSVTYNWGSGFVSENTHTYCTVGDHTVTVQVIDGDGGTATDTLMVTVNNVLPTITMTGGPYNGVVDEVLTFTATGSDACLDDSLTVEWDFGTGFSTDNINSWPEIFSGTVGLRITDTYGGEATDNVQVDIHDYAIDLSTEWNLFSIPLVPTGDDTSINNVLGGVAGEAEVVWEYKYDATAGRNVWEFSESDGTTWETFVSEIIPGYGYYIKMTDDSVLYGDGEKFYNVGGLVPMPPQVELATGWNLIGHYGINNVDKSDERNDLASSGQNPERHLANMNLLNEDALPGHSLVLGEGYWVFNTNSAITLYAPSEADYSDNFD